MDRAYSTLEIKAFDDETGTITGIASTPTLDRDGDIVVPSGAKYSLPLPLLWQHKAGDPIGRVVDAKVTAKGIEIVAQVALGVTDEIDRYWKLMKAGLVRGLSVGFQALEHEQIPGSFGRKIKSWSWLELSAVTIPANAEASIAAVKEFAAKPEQAAAIIQPAKKPAASGKGLPVVKLADPARVRAKPFVVRKIHV